MEHAYSQDQVVKIHSLGSLHGDREYLAVIHGRLIDLIDHGYRVLTLYIVDMMDPIEPAYPFTHGAYPEVCIKPCCSKAYADRIRLERAAFGRFTAYIGGGQTRVFADSPAKALEMLEVRADDLTRAGKPI